MSKHSTLPLFCGRLQSVKFKEEAIFQDWKTVGMMRENVIVRILKGKLYVTRIIENENYQQERWKCNSPAFIGNYKKTDGQTGSLGSLHFQKPRKWFKLLLKELAIRKWPEISAAEIISANYRDLCIDVWRTDLKFGVYELENLVLLLKR